MPSARSPAAVSKVSARARLVQGAQQHLDLADRMPLGLAGRTLVEVLLQGEHLAPGEPLVKIG